MGERIKQRRTELGITQEQLAEQLDISNNHLSTIENGKGNASLPLFCNICSALEVTPDYLLIGLIHKNDVPRNLTDMLQKCSDNELQFLTYLVEYFLFGHSGNERPDTETKTTY